MPKLGEVQIRRRMRRVEDAALGLFKSHGFHGVGLREIARAAKVSLGNIYNYYDGKEELFDSLLARLNADFSGPDTPLAAYLATCAFPADLERLGQAVRDMVAAHADYLTLIYVDIAEFDGRHVRPHYASLAARFRVALASRGITEPLAGGVEPAVAFTAAYMQLFNYFIVERMIGAEGHLGLGDDAAVHTLAGIYRRGLQPGGEDTP